MTEQPGQADNRDSTSCAEGGALWMTVVVTILLFFLTAGLAGSVDVKTLRSQLKRRAGLACGLLCQFLLMPFIGFVVVSVANPPSHVGLTLMILCSSSGGAYSNWWCSLFNADLALSVAMTAVSTLISAFMLPLNLTVYLSIMGRAGDVHIPWVPLAQSLASVLCAILAGVGVSTLWPRSAKWMTPVGNFSGICMIIITVIASVLKKGHQGAEEVTPLWGHEWSFYCLVCAPFVIAIAASLFISSLRCIGLKKPERTAIVVEVSYQNQGIASAVAISAFCGNAKLRADAAAVPIVYGLIESTALAAFCLVMWKLGWSYAPPTVSLFAAIKGDFQPRMGENVAAEEVAPVEVADEDVKMAEVAEVAKVADLEAGKLDRAITMEGMETEAPSKTESLGTTADLSIRSPVGKPAAHYDLFLPGTSVGMGQSEDEASLKTKSP